MIVNRLFLSVGAMKAGTTFLYQVFQRNPHIHFTPEKELHFLAHADGMSARLHAPLAGARRFSLSRKNVLKGRILTPEFRRHRLSMVMHHRYARIRDVDELRAIVRWYADRYLSNPIDDEWFGSIFEGAGERYAADFSNYHALLGPDGWAHAKRIAGELKVIYVMREPVARMWSHIKFQLSQSGERDRLMTLTRDDVAAFLCDAHVSAHARYGDIAASLIANLSPDQLKFVFLEDFLDNFPASANEIEEFLGIERMAYADVDTGKKANAGIELEMPDFVRESVSALTAPQLDKLESLGLKVPEAYRRNA